MFNKYSGTVSDLIRNVERLIAITEHLKIITQDGLDSILDENQKKEVQDILDNLTEFQRTDFKLMQVFENRDEKVSSILNRLYSILPSDILKSIFAEKNDYGDLPEDLISEIAEDGKNNSVNDSSNDDSKVDVEVSKEEALMNQIMDLSSTSSINSTSEDTSSIKNADEVNEIALPVQEPAKEEVASDGAKEANEIALPAQEPAKEEVASDGAKEVNEIALPAQETAKEDAAPEVAKEVNEIALPAQVTAKEDAAPEVAKEVSETAPTLQVPAKEKVEVNITGNDLEGNIVLPVLQQEINEEKPVIASLDTTPVHDVHLIVVSRGNSKPLVVTSTQLANLKKSLPSQLEKISPFLNLSSQERHNSSLKEMVQGTEDLSNLVVDDTNLEEVIQLMEDANNNGNTKVAEKISELIFAYNNKDDKSDQKTLSLSNAA